MRKVVEKNKKKKVTYRATLRELKRQKNSIKPSKKTGKILSGLLSFLVWEKGSLEREG